MLLLLTICTLRVMSVVSSGHPPVTLLMSAPSHQINGNSNEEDNLSLWENKWEANQIGWHKSEINHVLNHQGGAIIPGWTPRRAMATVTKEKRHAAALGRKNQMFRRRTYLFLFAA
mmetsp:Transcript_12362/g.35348  ORF Transcript_12362/g.35348 Transcript_12362/m.35348 type:complete len:116 (-) Transcript_12362:1417-1764(-)